MQCPQQDGDVECGFYVMRFMKDLITDTSILTKQNVRLVLVSSVIFTYYLFY